MNDHRSNVQSVHHAACTPTEACHALLTGWSLVCLRHKALTNCRDSSFDRDQPISTLAQPGSCQALSGGAYAPHSTTTPHPGRALSVEYDSLQYCGLDGCVDHALSCSRHPDQMRV
ncbi:hypothetical protein CEXT_742061 [Caerostris extrusa]|uniref:Uncharacterized protein n=1 Tax=Caerostris extrusa TaxID=172846 RepID=A0AAV4SJC8_CAEEX|nr:hypothetical protein CEXT_742061 [Caerostris extrusa]